MVCVYFKKKRICVYDSLPNYLGKEGWQSFVDLIHRYIQDEHWLVKGSVFDGKGWKWETSLKANCPIQAKGSNDCGVYTCFTMELLMNRTIPARLTEHVDAVTRNGRVVLWNAINIQKPAFACQYRERMVMAKTKITTS